jgi:hypothetical protein
VELRRIELLTSSMPCVRELYGGGSSLLPAPKTDGSNRSTSQSIGVRWLSIRLSGLRFGLFWQPHSALGCCPAAAGAVRTPDLLTPRPRPRTELPGLPPDGSAKNLKGLSDGLERFETRRELAAV